MACPSPSLRVAITNQVRSPPRSAINSRGNSITDAAVDTPQDSGHGSDGGAGEDARADADGGAGEDANVDAGQGNTCPGTTTPGPLPASFNCSSHGSTCGSCLDAEGGGETVCVSCTNDQSKSNCLALLQCLGSHDFGCLFTAPANGVACYCSNTTCSAGVNGGCAAQLLAVAGTTDPAEVLTQLLDTSTTVNRVVQEGQRFGNTPACDMFCSCL
jgi:hypothetical protein